MKKIIGKLALFAVFVLACIQARADTCNGFSNNLVTNCGFETRSFANWTGSTTTDFQSGVDDSSPFSGKYGAYLGANRAATTLTQTIATAPGQTYLVEFALMNDMEPTLGNQNSFAVFFDGKPLFSELAAGADSYQLYAFSTSAVTNNAALSFVSRNDAGYFNLDSISVTASTPEPSSWMLMGTGFAFIAASIRVRSGRIAF